MKKLSNRTIVRDSFRGLLFLILSFSLLSPFEVYAEYTLLYNKEEMEILKSLAEKGNPEAMYVLGKAYSNHHAMEEYGVEFDFYLGEKYYREASKKGFGPATYELRGWCYEGWICQFDIIEKAANQNCPIALLWMAMVYSGGSNLYKVKPNQKKAIEYFKRAEATNDDEVLFEIGIAIKEDDMPGRKKNINEGIEYLKRSAEQGNPDAAEELSNIYKNGEGVSVNLEEAKKWEENHNKLRTEYKQRKLLEEKKRLGIIK